MNGAPRPAPQRLLDVRNLTIEVAARGGNARVVDGVSFHVDRGETLGVVGESGCGKSLSMMSLVGLLPNKIRVAAGEAVLAGRNLLAMPPAALRRVRGSEVGFVFQDPQTSLNPVMRIGAQLAEPLVYHRGFSRAEARKRAGEILGLVGIPVSRLDSYPHELSGGQRQRVMIAIGLACEPSLLIADEPTTALDVTIQAQIVDLVRSLRDRLGMSIIWITHDLALVAGLAERIIVLYAGTIVEDAPVDALYEQPLHPYTKGLLASIPRLSGSDSRKLASIAGTPPEPGRRPRGCPFAPRCSLAMPVCHAAVPQLEAPTGTSGHRVACFAVNAPKDIAA